MKFSYRKSREKEEFIIKIFAKREGQTESDG